MKRLLEGPLSADEGFTLAETLVTLVVFGIVGAIVTSASISGLHHQTEVQNRNDALGQMRTALQRIDRDVRSAYPLLSATATQIVLEEVQPSVTRVMTYSVVGTQLVVDETDTAANGTTTTAARRTLLSNLVSTATSPVFSFAPVPGYTAPAGSNVVASTCAMSASAYDPGCVGTITVQLNVQPPRLTTPLSMTDNGTSLRNAT